MITTSDPRTGTTVPTSLDEDSASSVRAKAEAARDAGPALEALGRPGRAELLETIASALEADREGLVGQAVQETGLTPARLSGEVGRAAQQFRHFADVLNDGGYLEAAVDRGDPSAEPPVSDVRRMLVPLGPVGVFGASNFPFAFSVAGGDTASALAAGCPVVVKAHPSHPLTSTRSASVLREAMAASGDAATALDVVYGEQAGIDLVADPAIQAVGFTGSLRAGRALMAVAQQRDNPIPFYGELSSINPLVITNAAAEARATSIADGLFASVTGSGGQLCTKPGVALVPEGDAGDLLVARLGTLFADAEGAVLLNAGIRQSYVDTVIRLSEQAALLSRGPTAAAGELLVAPTLLGTTADEFVAELAEECFGPAIVVVRHHNTSEVLRVLAALPSALTGTVHCEEEDEDTAAPVLAALRSKVGRLVVNGYPTGVRVSWAQHHGGPWPATSSHHTSVGATAIRRFLRPVAWQDAPAWMLPEELRDDQSAVPRRVDGRLVLPG